MKSKKKKRTLNELRQTKDRVYKHPTNKRLVDETEPHLTQVAAKEIFIYLMDSHLHTPLYLETKNKPTDLGKELIDALENIIEHEILKLPKLNQKKWSEADKVLHDGKWYIKY